jgi:hypothetical protein
MRRDIKRKLSWRFPIIKNRNRIQIFSGQRLTSEGKSKSACSPSRCQYQTRSCKRHIKNVLLFWFTKAQKINLLSQKCLYKRTSQFQIVPECPRMFSNFLTLLLSGVSDLRPPPGHREPGCVGGRVPRHRDREPGRRHLVRRQGDLQGERGQARNERHRHEHEGHAAKQGRRRMTRQIRAFPKI